MPDLSYEACHEYWSKHSDPAVYKAICFMESVEEWTADTDEEVSEHFTSLGDSLHGIEDLNLDYADEIIFIASQVKASRKLMLMQILNESSPGYVARLLKHAEKSQKNEKSCQLFLKRNILFERLRLLGRIFAPESTKKIKEVLEAI